MGSGESKERQETAAACAVAATSAAALIWGLSSGRGEEKAVPSGKMMKAPGRNGELMPRDEFEGDTRTYFRDLRGKGNFCVCSST
ncbi:uncharacterized protein A4U43_UnF5030 [Asparagus officinalis]|uniref:Uncharacterized protein n=1 Tax=Asparagus officinalis TaxID=4686 RepID=A0A1R3L6S9_ASPOF|nr:uncharacterized protein A4U43_UnF5030 [Asparagus officinalis]